MAKKNSKTIFVRWVCSGIGFSYQQKRMIRSLGLRHLNHTVELQDMPSVRGLVARIPHLVEIVTPKAMPPWLSTPEYSIQPGEAAAQPAREQTESEIARSEVPETPKTPSDLKGRE